MNPRRSHRLVAVHRRHTLLALAVLSSLTLGVATGCSSSATPVNAAAPAADHRPAAAYVTALTDVFRNTGVLRARSTARCSARALVAALGPPRFLQAQVQPDDIEESFSLASILERGEPVPLVARRRLGTALDRCGGAAPLAVWLTVRPVDDAVAIGPLVACAAPSLRTATVDGLIDASLGRVESPRGAAARLARAAPTCAIPSQP